VPKDLSVRVHSCPFCGLVLDRDHNAAINILGKSNSTVGITGIYARQGILDRDSMQRDAAGLLGGGNSHKNIMQTRNKYETLVLNEIKGIPEEALPMVVKILQTLKEGFGVKYENN